MSNAEIRGRFVWHELMTTDTGAASEFYSRVVPWKTQDSGMPSYTLWMSGKNRAGGLMALPDDASGTPPHWIIYIGTPDVDATVAAAEKIGGKVLKGASDIPTVGRFAVLSDPQGAAFAVFTPTPSPGDGPPPGGGVGDFTWHELATTDPDSALRFYSDLFGWTKGAAHDMGEMGVYQLVSHGGKDVGGVYKARDNSTPPSWLSYVSVADAAKAAAAAKNGGGRILNGPMEVPGGSWIVTMLDPQGGAFAVVEPPKAAQAGEKPSAAAESARKAAKKAPAKKAPVKKAPAKKAPVPAAAAKAPAGGKTAAKKAAGVRKSAAARKTAAAKKPAAKRPAKRAAAKKSATAKRGSAAKKVVKGGKRAAKSATRGKAKSKGKKRR